MICKMTADILFDREITDDHHISPGGYEIVNDNENTTQFDFQTYYGFIDNVNRKILHIEVQDLDLDSFPGAISLESLVKKTSSNLTNSSYTQENIQTPKSIL